MRHYSIITLFLVAILQSSCQANLPVAEVPDEKVSVSLSVSTLNVSLTHGISEIINSVHILVFKASTSELEQAPLAYTVQATLQEGNKLTAVLSPSNNKDDLYRFVILANAEDAKIARLSQGSTYNQISQALYEDARQRYSTDTPIPMFGVVRKGEGIQVKEGMSLGAISLIRAVARIDIGVGTYNEETGKWDLGVSDKYFQLTDVEAWSPMNRNFDMPAGGNFSYELNGTPLVDNATGSLEHSTTKAVRWKYTGTDILNNNIATYCKDIIYLPEAALYGYTAHQPLNSDKRTALIIGGILHDPANPATKTKTWYRVDFTTAGGNTPDGALFDILRNHLYRISLNVGTAGAASAEEAWNIFMTPDQIKVDVASWMDGGSVDTPNSPSISLDSENSTLPTGVDIVTANNRINVSNIGGEMWLAFCAETSVEVTNVANPFPERLQIDRNGTAQAVGDKMVTRFRVTVQRQTLGQESYAVQVDLKSPLQQLSYNRFTINVYPSDKQFEVVTLGGRTWMAFNSMGKGNNLQLYLEPGVTVQEMYEQHWVETLGRQFQFGVNEVFVPWEKPIEETHGYGPAWNGKPDGPPCPDGYRAPTISELKALFPKSALSLQEGSTYTYNGETIIAALKQGNPKTITFPGSTITGYPYYITLTSQKTGNVIYIPFGGWKTDCSADPNTLNGIYFWAHDYPKSWGMIKKGNEMLWELPTYDQVIPQDSYAYMRCIKK